MGETAAVDGRATWQFAVATKPLLPSAKSGTVAPQMDPEWSVADALDRLAPPADEALTGAARARVHALAAHLPAALTRVVYLESWIGQPRPRLDLIVKLDPRDRDALADLVYSGLGPELRVQPGWAHVARFARAWATVGSPLHESLRAAWLEFDLDPLITPDAALRSPRVFVDFTREAQCWPSVEARLDLATEVLWALSGSRPPRTVESLRACLEHLPGGANLAYLGVFANDGQPPVVRACVVGLAGNLAAYLGAVGWAGDVDALTRSLLDPLARAQGEGAQPVGVLHLNLAPSVCPRIGLEYTFSRPRQPTGLRSEDTFLRQLVERGWCTARNRESLRSWPRQSVELMPHDIWHSRITRLIGHVKLTYASGEPVCAKAYLRAAFDLLAGGTLFRGRPRQFGTAAGPDHAAPQSCDLPAVRSRARHDTVVAHFERELRRKTGMTMSTAQQEALEQVLTRAAVDLDFRKALLVDPRKAILDGFGVRIPATFRLKFVERAKDVDALIVLPDFQRQDGELEDDDLDMVAGGNETDPPPPW
ncbi:MAG TPA: hypothetical protein VNO30_35835 [Kofleriaceae bacterium]|nr:hypothetical protein [Kofleriaceae bacterium]